MTDLLIVVRAGALHVGERFYFRRTTFLGRDQTGWVTARSTVMGSSGVLITGTDDRGRCRTIRSEEITRIKPYTESR